MEKKLIQLEEKLERCIALVEEVNGRIEKKLIPLWVNNTWKTWILLIILYLFAIKEVRDFIFLPIFK